ncbi:MAG: hypothetical protein H7A24_11025 [Leptospiraceae bacterium]|nr:hypothetical protein [Leptospiraceae bacterium]MCP5512405.1 hypothetical protein [Leptospiraceae bacterium]
MPQEKDFITILKTDYHNYERSAKSLLKSYIKLNEFFSQLSHYIPTEFLFVLLITLIITILLNAVSKKTRIFHLAIAVTTTVVASIVLSRFMLHKYRDWGFISSGLIILIPTYFYSGVVYLVTYARKQYIKNKISSPSTISQSLFNLHNSYNTAVMHVHMFQAGNDISVEEIREKLLALRLSTDGLLMTLEMNNPKSQTAQMQSIPDAIPEEEEEENDEPDLDYGEEILVESEPKPKTENQETSTINFNK